MKTSKEMTNVDIAELLRAVGVAYKIKGASKNKFKVIAYDRAADAVEHLSSEAKDLWDEGKLTDVAGIGKSISEHLGEIFKSGKSIHFEKVMKGVDPAVFELIKVPGIGAKTAQRLVGELGVKSVGDLQRAAREGKIEGVEGFGSLSQKSIERSIAETRGRTVRILLPYAEKLAGEILEWVKKDKNVSEVSVLGSLRRKASTVGDIDLAAATTDLVGTLEHFAKYPKKTRVLEKGEKTASIIVPGNRQIDLMVTAPESYGSLLQHFTGSKHHNIALREYANKKKMSLSEYGIKKLGGDKIKKFSSEEEFYKHLGLEWITPELREDVGEIEASLSGKLPKLIETGDIKGDFQIHSSFNTETSHDLGADTMETIAKRADELGYEYIAMTEHNPSKSGHSEGEMVKILRKKRERVEQINASGKYKVHIFNSLEIDILPNGDLPVSKEGLDTLDFALVSIHSSFRQSRAEMTARVLKALSNPKVKIFAHPTARKINHRESVELNWPMIFKYCKKYDKWLEINGEPMRLDLPDFLVRDAVKAGVKMSMGTDSHSVEQLDNMKYGVGVARRGWATKRDVVCTRSLRELKKMI